MTQWLPWPPPRKHDDPAEDQEKLIRDWVRTLEPIITMLPAGTHNKRVPYQCSICKTATWPGGKVGEADQMRLSSVQHYIGRHLRSDTHVRNQRLAEEVIEDHEIEVPCDGISPSDPATGGALVPLVWEAKLWCSMANFVELAKHSYTYDANEDSWTIRAADCLQQTQQNSVDPNQRHACAKCKSLASPRGIVRNLNRFMLKYWMAQILSCRLFQGDLALTQLMDKLRASAYYTQNKKKLDDMIRLDNARMQQWVRCSFLPDAQCSRKMKDFIDMIVRPSLQISVASVPSRLSDISAKFACILAGNEAEEQDLVDVKLAAAAISGRLQNHPLIQGLLLQVARMLEKQERGIFTMSGRRSQHTDLERDLVQDAGIQLAVAAGNNALARQFGLSSRSHVISMEVLEKNSLPVPPLSVCFPDTLRQNWVLVDQRNSKAHDAPKRVSPEFY